MLRFAVFIALVAAGSAANAVTVRLETKSAVTGITGGGVEVGGFDFDTYDSDAVAGTPDETAEVTSQQTMPGGETSGLASANIATGEIRAKIQTDPGTLFGDEEVPAEVYGANGVGYSQVEISETFTATGKGTFRFTIAFDGSWDIEGQPVDGGGPRLPFWRIDGSVVFIRGSEVFSDGFSFSNDVDANKGSIDLDVKPGSVEVEDDQTYSVFVSLVTEVIGQAKGFIDFSNTAVISFEADPGVGLNFSDDRFLSDAATVAPVPIPASGYLLLLSLAGLLGGARMRMHRKP